MKIIKFRIKNYKSIKDTGDCYLDPKITILAGKNEAGKSAIVEALEDFNLNKEISRDAIPIYDKSLKPEIELLIELDKEDLNKIVEEFDLESITTEKNSLIIKKIFPNEYVISDESFFNLIQEKGNLKELSKRISKSLGQIKEKVINFPLEESRLGDLGYQPSFENYTPQFQDGLSIDEQNKIKKEIDEKIIVDISQLNSIKQLRSNFVNFVKNNFIPNFILFKTFDDVLPDQISITEAQNNPLIKDLTLISSLNFSQIQPTALPDDREKHREKVNLEFRRDYKQFWTQDHSNLYFWWDSNNMYFRIKEGEELYKPAIRSKGRQWHLAYYIRVTARSVEGKNNLILIDEPGLFLHAKAQKDILKRLDKCSEQSQIMYTTHSPYLIPSDKLARVRLVIKSEKEGTKTEKITAKADKETLTPILTAIGEDLSAGIRVDKKNSIVVEGYSDYILLIAFRKLLDIREELNFVPAVGGDSSIYIGCILFGWGLDPIFILDNDKKGKQVKGKLEKKLSVDEKRIILVPENKEGCIENLFSKEDFEKYLRAEKYSKALSAIQFYQKVEREEIKLLDLSEKTQNHFRKLFKKIMELF